MGGWVGYLEEEIDLGESSNRGVGEVAFHQPF